MSCSIVTTERRLTAVVRAKVPFGEIPEVQRSARAKLAATLAKSQDHGCGLTTKSLK